jgi:hypothetical protein
MCATLDTTVFNPAIQQNEAIAPTHCDTTAGALDYGLVEGGTFGMTHIAWGLVPNGNATVTVRLVSGETEELPVTNNAFAATVPDRVASFGFTDATGSQITVP